MKEFLKDSWPMFVTAVLFLFGLPILMHYIMRWWNFWLGQ